MNLLVNKPESFEDYVLNPQTPNYMVGFLLGKKMYDNTPTTNADLEQVISAIDNLPIYVGIFEQFSESLNYFGENLDIKWNDDIEVKRMRRMNRVLDGRNIKDSRECMKNQTSKGSTEAHLLQL